MCGRYELVLATAEAAAAAAADGVAEAEELGGIAGLFSTGAARALHAAAQPPKTFSGDPLLQEYLDDDDD